MDTKWDTKALYCTISTDSEANMHQPVDRQAMTSW